MSKRKERMRAGIEEGRTAFILKEGLYHFGLKLWLLYMLVTFIITYRFDFSMFLTPGELIRSALYLLVFFAIGAYWGFIWYQVHTTEKKREEEERKKQQKDAQKNKRKTQK
ncbi:hypothetical protein CR194_00510 [Salipaludibacillus keqinensis]|uniref:Uncharacterized protein n=1 Tax=Salipaludibacillus keqinensis TaxID=2045207 RepID=A0A323TGV1_9BACI|nr:hypothetical protein [Salipaludibacillus keqinensis]PYZ94058.1 hypothetical protein CR194_00510 [Salipaludibacillus keqinensis]